MTTLSPAAQAVLDSANSRNSYGPDDCLNESRWIAAAALRAAADQVVPQRREPMYADSSEESTWTAQQDTRAELLAIADELENQ